MERRRPSEKREGPIGRGERSDAARPIWQERVKRDRDVEKSPLIPSEITPEDLDLGVRVQLKTLTAENAEMVARHLAMVNLLIDKDPELAHKHALAASRRAGRLAIVHETLGVTAYTVGDYALALRELLTHRRLSGSLDQIPLIVDSERGMNRPAKALEAAAGIDRKKLAVGVRINLAIALSGARLDLGDAKNAKLELEIPELSAKQIFPQSPLLFRSYAEVLRELGQSGEAWDDLADRAEKALGEVGEELFELVEEIAIPTSSDFEKRPARKFDEDKKSSYERKPRQRSDGRERPARSDGEDRPRRDGSSTDRKPRERTDEPRDGRRPRPSATASSRRRDSEGDRSAGRGYRASETGDRKSSETGRARGERPFRASRDTSESPRPKRAFDSKSGDRKPKGSGSVGGAKPPRRPGGERGGRGKAG
ncbi:MAG: hypothetical protein RLZ65_632 [Actinomycetota bacterium]|jgi:hypothetical protein